MNWIPSVVVSVVVQHSSLFVCLGAVILIYALLLSANARRRREREDAEFKRYAKELGNVEGYNARRRERIEADRGWRRA